MDVHCSSRGGRGLRQLVKTVVVNFNGTGLSFAENL